MQVSSDNMFQRTLRSGRLMVAMHKSVEGGSASPSMSFMVSFAGGGNVSANSNRPGQFRVHQQAPGGMPVSVPVRV